MTDKEAVWQFLNDLKSQRETQKRLRTLAAENPEAVIRYLDSLPTGWETALPTDEASWLIELRAIALANLPRK